MKSEHLNSLYSLVKNPKLFGRYITNSDIEKCLAKYPESIISTIGYSVEKKPIYGLKFGKGSKKILLWSQMHGNESTTTKAIFDVLNTFYHSDELHSVLLSLKLVIIPILNPDGAAYYTRLNANGVDLNRDAQDLSQAESNVLRTVFNKLKPDYCFNLHGQRTIYGVGNTGHSSVLSFLSPAQDATRSLTETRKTAMAIITAIAEGLKSDLPNGIARYDDGFNINCVGDTFQSLDSPTVLFEAGHFKNDYDREEIRCYIFKAILLGILAISNGIDASNYKPYFDIPENQKNFYDVIIRNTKLIEFDTDTVDVAIQFEEVLDGNRILFKPFVIKIENLSQYFAHKEIDTNNNVVLDANLRPLKVGNEIDFVMLKNKKILIKP